MGEAKTQKTTPNKGIKISISWAAKCEVVTILVPKTAKAHNFFGIRSTMLKFSGAIHPLIFQKMVEIVFQKMLIFGQIRPIFEIF